jgi:hypothetical protein
MGGGGIGNRCRNRRRFCLQYVVIHRGCARRCCRSQMTMAGRNRVRCSSRALSLGLLIAILIVDGIVHVQLPSCVAVPLTLIKVGTCPNNFFALLLFPLLPPRSPPCPSLTGAAAASALWPPSGTAGGPSLQQATAAIQDSLPSSIASPRRTLPTGS